MRTKWWQTPTPAHEWIRGWHKGTDLNFHPLVANKRNNFLNDEGGLGRHLKCVGSQGSTAFGTKAGRWMIQRRAGRGAVWGGVRAASQHHQLCDMCATPTVRNLQLTSSQEPKPAGQGPPGTGEPSGREAGGARGAR